MRYTRHILQTIALTVALLAAGQSAWATTKTVTYKITDWNLNSSRTAYEIVFTRSGDTPFDTSAPTTYTASVPKNSISSPGTPSPDGNSGEFSVELADGFKLSLEWHSGSNVRFLNNCIGVEADNRYITYTVSCPNTNYYYVTHVMLTGMNSNYEQGLLQPAPHYNEYIDYDYVNLWVFSQSYQSRYDFGQLTVTYSDVPALSIFESDGENAYKIKDKHDLRHLANYVNNGHNDCGGLSFRQTTNITCDNTYVPIGNSSYGFKGTYDGQDNTVSGITVTRTGMTNADRYIGLFGHVLHSSATVHGTVKNVILANSTFTGFYYIGGIVGYCTGTVQNCRVENTVTINSGTNAAASFGGIVGLLQGSRSNVIGCISAAALSRNGFSVASAFGGIVGNLNDEGTIKNCLYTGSSIDSNNPKGAVLGSLGSGTLTNNYYTDIDLGGVNGSDADGARRARIVTLDANVALVGDETAYNVSGLTAIGSRNYALRRGNTIYSGEGQTLTFTYTGAAPAEGYNIAIYVNGVQATDNGNGTYTATMPAADATVTAGQTPIPWSGSGTQTAPWRIQYPSQLDLLATNVNNGNDYKGKYFELANDITYTHSTTWDDATSTENNYTAIGSGEAAFEGTFDGDGHSVSGIRLYRGGHDSSADGYQGLFGNVGSYGIIKNLTVNDARITGRYYVGGIAGYALLDCTIENCHATATVAIHAVVDGAKSHGGIVGDSGATIIGCTSSATLTLADGLTECEKYGGIAGYSGYIVKNCFVIDANVKGSSSVGAIVGTYYGQLENNYYSGCTVNGATANVGIGSGDVTANEGAVQVYTITTGTGISASATAAVSHAGTDYYAAGTTVTLSYNGSMPEGANQPVYSVNGAPVEGNSFEMPAADVTVTMDVSISYIDENGVEQRCCNYTFLTSSSGDQTLGDSNNDEAWYVVSGEITIGGTLNFVDKAVHLILCDGAKLTVSGDDEKGMSHIKIGGLFIYGQRSDTGSLEFTSKNYSGIWGNKVTINGGTLTATGTQYGIFASSSVTVYGGTVTATGTKDGIYASSSVTINDGTVTATATTGTYNSGINSNFDVTINGGTVSATGDIGINAHRKATINGGKVLATGPKYGIYCSDNDGSVTIKGGNVIVTGDVRGISVPSGSITLGWTNVSDCITASSYACYSGFSVSDNQAFIDDEGHVYSGQLDYDAIVDKTLRPYLDQNTAQALTLMQGTKDGVTAWWGTFYNGNNYVLSEGAAAYTLGSDYKLYRLGVDGRTITQNIAVVIIATEATPVSPATSPATATIGIFDMGLSTMTAADHAPGGNILQGSGAAIPAGKSAYVLSVDADGVIGFRQYTGTDAIPAGKAFYVQ